jgi:outer membrane protein TolC
VSNVGGFTGQNTSYQIVLTAQMTLDASVYFTAKAASAQRAAAEARYRRAELNARDELYSAQQQVKSQIAASEAATAQLEAAQKAAKLVKDRYAVGAATQLEVTQADRDAFQADVMKIQALGDLAVARALVRIDSGKTLPKEPGQ